MRLSYMDSARASLMLLGIPYHAALVYHIHKWIVQDNSTSYLLSYFAEFLHLFRMPAFFIIAGFFSLMSLEKAIDSLPWFRKRAVRLIVPLIFSILIILPNQALFATWPGPFKGSGLSHLWFLVALAFYSAILAGTWRTWVGFSKMRYTPLAVLLCTFVIYVVLFTYEEAYGDPPYYTGAIIRYLPYFFVGVMFRANPQAWEFFTRARWPLMMLALATAAAFPWLALHDQTNVPAIVRIVAENISVWLATYAALTVLRRFFDRPLKIVDTLVPAAFTIYLFHHPIIIGLARIGQFFDAPAVVEWVILVVVAGILSFLVHLLVRSSWVTRFLFNGEPPPGFHWLEGGRDRISRREHYQRGGE